MFDAPDTGNYRATDHQSAPLYPPLEPFSHGWMEAGDGHRIYFEECGNPRGLPVVVLHGGPASGCSPLQRRFFDPEVFRVVLFDQRGCGRSTPRGGLAHNDTEALIRDIEQLRGQLRIADWIVFGGSWGASLAIAYAAQHTAVCRGVVLRGTFLTGSRDLDWFFGGAASLLPDAWQKLLQRIELPLSLDQCEHAGHAVLAVLKRRVFSDEPQVADATAAAWAEWEDAVSRPGVGRPGAGTPGAGTPGIGQPGAGQPGTGRPVGHAMEPTATATRPAVPHPELVDKYRVQVHYLSEQCFLGEERLLAFAASLGGLPVHLVHGRLDWVCRPTNAWQVHQAIPGSVLTWVDHAGHNPYEAPMLKALGEALRHVRG